MTACELICLCMSHSALETLTTSSVVFLYFTGEHREERYYLIMPFGPKGHEDGRREREEGGGKTSSMRQLWWSGVGGQSNGKPGADVGIVSIVTPPPPCLVRSSSLANTPVTHKNTHWNKCTTARSDLPSLPHRGLSAVLLWYLLLKSIWAFVWSYLFTIKLPS